LSTSIGVEDFEKKMGCNNVFVEMPQERLDYIPKDAFPLGFNSLEAINAARASRAANENAA
jgi:hypothetical protein